MQNTRLNSLVDTTTNRLVGWLRNPWRRLSILIISLLLGNFLGTAISTIAGQRSALDVLVAAFLIVITESISFIAYRTQSESPRSLLIEILNTLKIGLIYSMFVEAFKLGS